jgi:hypothetical protein
MDKTLLPIIIPQGVALLIVFLNFLFNYLNKNKEFKHNEHLKKLELEQREKERKFKVEEKMIEKSIEAHKGAWSRVLRMNGFVNQYVGAAEDREIPESVRDKFYDLVVEVRDWNDSEGLFMEKRVRRQLDYVVVLALQELRPGRKPYHPNMDIFSEMTRAIQGLRKALETIMNRYNPLYDLDIELPEIESR